MRIESKFRPELLALDNSNFCRPMLNNLNVVTCHEGVSAPSDWTIQREMGEQAGFVIATNGKALVVLPCLLEKGDILGPVRGDILKLARQFRKKAGGNLRIKLGRHRVMIGGSGSLSLWVPGHGVILPRLTEKDSMKYPDTNDLYPNKDITTPQPQLQVSFNAAILTRLVQAMGATEGADFQFYSSNGPVVVRAEYGGRVEKSSMGIIMPRRLE